MEVATTSEAEGDLERPASPAPATPRFEDHGVMARGGMGDVRRMTDHALGRPLVRKEIRPDRADLPGIRRRFWVEARITAELAHPGVVSVHDTGFLEDGRPFYTMDEVRGITLREAIAAVHEGRPNPRAFTPRRLLEALLRVAETVAYAHSRRILHRDLKPENILLGEFGAVLVADWGLARRLSDPDVLADEPGADEEAHTAHGRLLGTPGYLSPEQARGELEAVGPPSDVFSLGCMLFEVATGRRAFPGDVSERLWALRAGRIPTLAGPAVDLELAALWIRALQADPADRHRDAEEFARALSDWLAGAHRRERALEVTRAADAHLLACDAALRTAETLRVEARALLAPLRAYDDAEAKKAGWRKEDAAAEESVRAELEGSRYVSALHGALQIDPSLPEAHARLAAWHRRAHEAAERAHDRGAMARTEQLLRAHDRGEHAAYLAGTATLRLRTEPPLARARISAFRLRDRRLEPELVEERRASSDREALELGLPAGSYLVEIEAPARAAVRHPILLERGGVWEDRPLCLPRELAEDDCFVPAGPFVSGGDPEAADGLPVRRVWVPSFVIRRHPVCNAEYREFLQDLQDHGRADEAEDHAPFLLGPSPTWPRTPEGRLRLSVEAAEGPWLADLPVIRVSWHTARAYARWRADRDGLPWRLPHSFEWEKAARGVDGRRFPWGDHLEPSWANTVDSHRARPGLSSIHAFPLDESPYGVRGLVGNTRDWCADDYRRDGPVLDGEVLPPGEGASEGESWKLMKGGAYLNGGSLLRPATRFGASPTARFVSVGIRLARDA